MESIPASQSILTLSGREPFELKFTVPREVAALILRVATATTSACRIGSPSQPWP